MINPKDTSSGSELPDDTCIWKCHLLRKEWLWTFESHLQNESYLQNDLNLLQTVTLELLVLFVMQGLKILQLC